MQDCVSNTNYISHVEYFLVSKYIGNALRIRDIVRVRDAVLHLIRLKDLDKGTDTTLIASEACATIFSSDSIHWCKYQLQIMRASRGIVDHAQSASVRTGTSTVTPR